MCWYPRMSFKIAKSNLNSDWVLFLAILIWSRWDGLHAAHPSVYRAGSVWNFYHSQAFLQVLHHSLQDLLKSPCLTSYFLSITLDVEVSLVVLGHLVTLSPRWSCCHTPRFHQSPVLWRWGSCKYCWPISIEFVFSSWRKHIRSI